MEKEYSERKYEYRDKLKESLDKAKYLVDDIFENINGNHVKGIDITFHVLAGEEITADYTIVGNIRDI